MKGTMKVAVMNGIGKMGYTSRPIPTPKEDEVLVKLEYVGICGSDMHYYETGAIGNYVVKPPFVLGHEPGGTVVEVGSAVKHLKVGDRVALEPGKTCGHCKFCREGKYNLCPDVVFFATPPVDGVFQEYVAHEANLCFKLPDNVSTMEGALIAPLAVGFHAANQGGAHAGQTAVVMGAGCIGLVSMMALKAEGVSRVYVVDIMQKRLDKALELGADGVINSREKDAVQTILDLTDGLGCDLVIETAGTEITTRQAIEMANIYSSIISGMMDAFASVISNNLNVIMKVLTSITVLLTVPNIIFGFYGMNITAGLPLDQFWWIPLILAVVTLSVVAIILKRHDLF